MTNLSKAAGVYTIASTPFLGDGSIDERSTDRMIDFFLQSEVTGITVLGQMGEAPKLDEQESIGLARRMIRRSSVPVIAGISAPGFAAMRSLSSAVMDAGAAGVMIAPPVSLRTDEQIVSYYRLASEAIGREVPFVIQDYPLTFSVVMTPAVIRRIVEEILVHGAQTRRLAGPGKDIGATQVRTGRIDAPHLNPMWQWRVIPRFRDGAWR